MSGLPSVAVRLVPRESALAGVTADSDVRLLLGVRGVLGVVGVELSGHLGGGGSDVGACSGGKGGGGVVAAAAAV